MPKTRQQARGGGAGRVIGQRRQEQGHGKESVGHPELGYYFWETENPAPRPVLSMELARPGHASRTEGYSLSNEVWPCGSAGKVPATKLTSCLIPGTHLLEAEEQFSHVVL